MFYSSHRPPFYLTLTLEQSRSYDFGRFGLYRVHEFAALAGVTVKALHHYDRLGLLRPRRSRAGYRIYVERDLERLEQIVALKFVGVPLKQIRTLLDRDAPGLPAVLRLQRSVLLEKRRLLDRALEAIANAEKAGGSAALRKIIEVMDMQPDIEFMQNYYRGEAWALFRARHPVWPSDAWRDLFRDITAALAEDPAGETAQALARRWRALRVADSAGDPAIHEGLIKAWNDRAFWPETAQRRLGEFDLRAISDFIARVFACYREAHYAELPMAPQLEHFPPEDRARPGSVRVGLLFNLAESVDEDPASERAQALAAQWMEVMESGTGSRVPTNETYEAIVQRLQRWPSALVNEIAALDRHKIARFVLKALAVGCDTRRSTPV